MLILISQKKLPCHPTFNNRELDPNYPLVGTSIIFTVVFRNHASNVEVRGLPKAHARKTLRRL